MHLSVKSMSRVKKELKPCEMINLPMVPFFTKFPEIAAVETRSLIIAKNKKIPTGIYGLLESYCDELNCDCRRVFINVVSQGSPAEILATISYGWETPEFYKKWMRWADPELIEMMTHPHLAIGCWQSEYAKDFLDLFQAVIKDTKYVERLARHYFLFKETVNKENQGAKRGKIGRNESCPCGSGKKYKKCCGSRKELKVN